MMFLYDGLKISEIFSHVSTHILAITITITIPITITIIIIIHHHPHRHHHYHHHYHHHPHPHNHNHPHHHPHHDEQPISPYVSPLFLGGTLAKGTRPECNNKCTAILYHFKSFHIIVYN